MKARYRARRIVALLTVVLVAVTWHVSLDAVPSAPTALTAQVTGNTVTLSWTPPLSGSVIAYKVEAGSATGVSNIVVARVEPVPFLPVSNVPDGTYFVRVRAVGEDGDSQPSNEVAVVVSSTGCAVPPAPPVGLSATINGGLVRLSWQADGGCPATNFIVVAGSAPSASNLGVANMRTALSLTASAPPGTYYLRVFAQNAFGLSGPSNEIVVQVMAVLSAVCRQVSATLTPAPFGDPDKAVMTARYSTSLTGRAFFSFTSYTRGAATGSWVDYDWWRQESTFPNGSSSVSALIDKPFSRAWRLDFKCDGVVIAALEGSR